MERLYDQETEHYCNEAQQAKWEEKIATKINNYIKNDETLPKKNMEEKIRKGSSQKKPAENKNSNWRIR